MFQSGEICHFGLLQAQDPDEESIRLSSYTEAQLLLWQPSLLGFYPDGGAGHCADIWSHSMSVSLLSAEQRSIGALNADIPPDMVPWYTCLWAPDLASHTSLQRISCFQPTGGAPCVNPYITGFELEYTDGRRLGGNGGPVPVQCPNWQNVTDPGKELASWTSNTHPMPFEQISMQHFEIDGTSGEMVTEVYGSRDMEAIKLRTNKNRVGYFGIENKENWFHYKVKEGQVIVGLACAFGRLAGWSSSAKMYSHWVLSDLRVLTVSQDYLEGKWRS